MPTYRNLDVNYKMGDTVLLTISADMNVSEQCAP